MSATTEYLLGASDEERDRLIAQGEIHRSEAEWLVDRIGLAAGSRALDIGCGPLGILDLLAGRTGSPGLVVGVDREPRMLEMARRSLAERGLEGVQLVAADAADTGQPAGSFDLVHSRLVLVNVPHPEQVVAEMARLVRPGGHVALQEGDATTWVCQPSHPAWDRLYGAVRAVWTDAGFDPYIGRRLPNLLRTAGLVDVGIKANAHVWGPADPYQMLLLQFVGIVRERIVGLGLMAEPELDALVAELSAHLMRPDTFVLHFLFFQAWGRKPENA